MISYFLTFHSKRPAVLSFVLLFVLCVSSAALSAAPDYWKGDIEAFVSQDRAHAPAQGGVLFAGSSSIRLWSSLKEDFPMVAVLNRGFGGSAIPDSVFYFDQIVMTSRPRVIVFFAGTNDIEGGASAERVAADFREFCNKVHAALPECRVIFISIAMVPSRWEQRATVALANSYIAAFCHADARRLFVDMNAVLLAPDGTPRREFYQKDMLHMVPAGYAEWTRVLRPLVYNAMGICACCAVK